MNAFTTQDHAWKDWDRYQTYCTAYKMQTVATCHRGAGCPIDSDINPHVEDTETTGLDNNNDSISGLDTTIALGGPEAESQQQCQVDSTHEGYNDLHQW